MNSLIPDLVVQRGQDIWIIDAKYKGHLEELDERRWAELGEALQQEHRHDLHQVLAYASVHGGERVTAMLAYPLRLSTWQALAEQAKTSVSATIITAERQLRVTLIGLPLQMPGPQFRFHLQHSWNLTDVEPGG